MDKKRIQTHRALLTEDDVRTIRSSKEQDKVLALKFEVSQQAIWECRKRKTWKHVE